MRRTRLWWLLVLLLCGVLPALAKKPRKPMPPFPLNGRPTVNLTVHTSPKVKAQVFWGTAALGDTPLTLPWPRDSGPVDVVVKAEGFLPLHTRLYTTGNDTVTVTLTPEAEKKSLFGYKHEAPPDGGVQPTSPPAAAPAAPDGGTR